MLKFIFLHLQILTLGFILIAIQSCNNSCASTDFYCRKQSDCQKGMICSSGLCKTAALEAYSYSNEIYEASQALLDSLNKRSLNIITAESVTGGMILSSLVDDPRHGSHIYGGIVSYDTKAKRKLLGVKVKDVYTKECSLEMAIGALMNSDALVSVAVKGKAGPVSRFDLNSLGIVDVAISVRTDKASGNSDIPADSSFPKTFTSISRRINTCTKDGHQHTRDLCEKYKIEAARGYVSLEIQQLVRKLIRQDTVINALRLTQKHIENNNCYRQWGTVACTGH